ARCRHRALGHARCLIRLALEPERPRRMRATDDAGILAVLKHQVAMALRIIAIDCSFKMDEPARKFREIEPGHAERVAGLERESLIMIGLGQIGAALGPGERLAMAAAGRVKDP